MNFIKHFFNMFCYVSTSIFLCSSIYCRILWGQSITLGLSYIWGVFAIAAISSLLYLIFRTENEVSKTKIIIFRLTYMIIMNVIVLVIGLYLNWFELSNMKMIVGMELTFIFTFILVTFAEYYNNIQDAQKINTILKTRSE